MRSYKKIILVILLTVVLLRVINIFFDNAFKRYYQAYFEKLDMTFRDSSYNDIIYMGNSRANFGINPYYIDSICNTKSYNLGLAGTDITETVLLLDAYLKRHPSPKIAVLVTDREIFKQKNYPHSVPLFLFYIRDKSVREQLEGYGIPANFIKLYPDIKYSFFNDYYRGSIISGLFGRIVSDQLRKKPALYEYQYRGFINYHDKEMQADEITYRTPLPIQYELRDKLTRLMDTCKVHHIQLVCIYPPEFYPSGEVLPVNIQKSKDKVDSLLTDMCSRDGCFFHRFDTHDFTEGDFADLKHVNLQGAEKFSIMVANYLKGIK